MSRADVRLPLSFLVASVYGTQSPPLPTVEALTLAVLEVAYVALARRLCVLLSASILLRNGRRCLQPFGSSTSRRRRCNGRASSHRRRMIRYSLSNLLLLLAVVNAVVVAKRRLLAIQLHCEVVRHRATGRLTVSEPALNIRRPGGEVIQTVVQSLSTENASASPKS